MPEPGYQNENLVCFIAGRLVERHGSGARVLARRLAIQTSEPASHSIAWEIVHRVEDRLAAHLPAMARQAAEYGRDVA